jgi:citronellol/citronellal dehydrogenase
VPTRLPPSVADPTPVISDACRGIALAIGVAVAKLGATVLLAKTDQPQPRLPGTVHTSAADIETAGGKAVPIPRYRRAHLRRCSKGRGQVER